MSRPLHRLVHRLAAATALILAAGALPAIGVMTADAAPDDSLFRPAPTFRPGGGEKVRISPREFHAVEVDLAGVRAALGGAPRAGSGDLVFRVPTPAGGTERFAVRRTTLMAPRLAAAHPEITTYAGRSLDNPGTTVALDLTPMGFHASVRSAQGQPAWYVDPAYNRRGTLTHLSYYGGDLDPTTGTFVERETRSISNAVARRSAGERTRPGGLVKRRIYRLALTSDPSYAAYFGTENVLAEKVTLVNRVNQIYNDDLAINMRLIAGTEKLNLDTQAEATGRNGPCGAHPCFDPADPDDPNSYSQLDFCSVETLGRNRVVLGQLVGASNYDIGHIALGVNGGGVAYLGVVGWDYKGGGCTGLPQPQGDFFAIDYVAHEMGHQFSGNHTFDGVQFACSGGNRNPRTSVEPGSGSSVMAYAGICLQDDLQPHSDPYFSQRTIAEVTRYTGNPTLPVVEVQTVSLRGFDTRGETITLRYGRRAPVQLTLGRNFNRRAIDAAITRLTGTDVTIAGWAYDPFGGESYPARLTQPSRSGFQVIFAANPRPDTRKSAFRNMLPLRVGSGSPGVRGFVGETAQGGNAENEGYRVVQTANHAPRVSAPPDRTIPLRTPFMLVGEGRDADGNSLTYLWEQNDVGGKRGMSLVTNRKKNGPLFRIFGRYADVTDEGTLQSPSPGLNEATGIPRRSFPDLRQVLQGNTNAETGRCPRVAPLPDDLDDYQPVQRRKINCYSEFLPIRGYVGSAGTPLREAAMHFRLTARDGFAHGGGTAFADVRLRISQSAGPFLVTSHDRRSDTVTGGGRDQVTWRVNGTRKLAGQVRILLSTNAGRDWRPIATTANDGRSVVRFPDVRTGRARLMVRAVDNYFYDVNDREFRIR